MNISKMYCRIFAVVTLVLIVKVNPLQTSASHMSENDPASLTKIEVIFATMQQIPSGYVLPRGVLFNTFKRREQLENGCLPLIFSPELGEFMTKVYADDPLITPDLKGHNMSNITVQNMDLVGVRIDGAVLAGARFLNCTFDNVDLGKAGDVLGAVFKNCTFGSNVEFGNTLQESVFLNCYGVPSNETDRLAKVERLLDLHGVHPKVLMRKFDELSEHERNLPFHHERTLFFRGELVAPITSSMDLKEIKFTIEVYDTDKSLELRNFRLAFRGNERKARMIQKDNKMYVTFDVSEIKISDAKTFSFDVYGSIKGGDWNEDLVHIMVQDMLWVDDNSTHNHTQFGETGRVLEILEPKG